MTRASGPELGYQTYIDERRAQVEAKRAASNSFDRAILSLSGGALALSLVFVKQIAPTPTSDSMPYLMGAWSTFGAAITAMLLSLISSEHAIQRQIDLLDDRQRSEAAKLVESNWWSYLIARLNWASIGLFVAGVTLLAVFVTMNLPTD